MHAAVMTLALYYARKTVKRELYEQGIKLANVESREITQAANDYIDGNPEIIAFATERYQDLVKRGILRAPKERRKPTQ